MNWRIASLVLALIVPMLLIFAKGFQLKPHEVPSALIGKPAPVLQTQTVEGAPFTTAAFHGKPIVINFWSTWCEACKTEHELLQRAAKHYEQKVQFIGVVYQDAPEAVQALLKQSPSVFPFVVDPGSKIALDFGVSGIPETFFIHPNGHILYKQTGPLTGDVLHRQLDPLVGRFQ